MITADRVIREGLQRSYSARNGGSGKFQDFIRTQGATGKAGVSREISWLDAKGGTGTGVTAKWDSYLVSKGFTGGSLKDRMRSFFTTGTQA